MWGFNHLKDLLDVVLVPGILAWLAFYWPKRLAERQADDRRSRFESLIKRELEELGPCPERKKKNAGNWTDYQIKSFLHARIIDNPSENRDFILSLEPTLIYQVSQLWEARKVADGDQWLHYLNELSQGYGGKITKAYEQWKSLIEGNASSSNISGEATR
jgi:hypothetical protein